jgi:hypothetical protein
MILLQLAGELTGACLTFVRLCFLSQSAILARLMAAEKQLCFFIERGAKPRRARTDEKILLVLLASFHNWRDSIVIVTPRTFQNWIRQYVLRRVAGDLGGETERKKTGADRDEGSHQKDGRGESELVVAPDLT